MISTWQLDLLALTDLKTWPDFIFYFLWTFGLPFAISPAWRLFDWTDCKLTDNSGQTLRFFVLFVFNDLILIEPTKFSSVWPNLPAILNMFRSDDLTKKLNKTTNGNRVERACLQVFLQFHRKVVTLKK